MFFIDDHSLIITEDDSWIAVLPAHRKQEILFSHWGLTYGGLVYDDKMKLPSMVEILKDVLEYLYEKGIEQLHIKTIPIIYHQKPADELNYALFLADAKLQRRDSLSVIDLSKPFFITKTRRESVRRGQKNGLEIREESNFRLFWDEVLIPNLDKKHSAKPLSMNRLR